MRHGSLNSSKSRGKCWHFIMGFNLEKLKTYIWCFLGASNFKEAMRMGAEIYQNLKSVVKKRYGIDGE